MSPSISDGGSQGEDARAAAKKASLSTKRKARRDRAELVGVFLLTFSGEVIDIPPKEELAQARLWTAASLRRLCAALGIVFAKEDKAAALRALIEAHRGAPPTEAEVHVNEINVDEMSTDEIELDLLPAEVDDVDEMVGLDARTRELADMIAAEHERVANEEAAADAEAARASDAEVARLGAELDRKRKLNKDMLATLTELKAKRGGAGALPLLSFAKKARLGGDPVQPRLDQGVPPIPPQSGVATPDHARPEEVKQS